MKEREREAFHVTVHDPDGHNAWDGGAVWSQEPGISSKSHLNVEAQALEPSSVALPGTLVGSGIKCGAVGRDVQIADSLSKWSSAGPDWS